MHSAMKVSGTGSTRLCLDLPSPDSTTHLGAAIAACLRAGDLVFLSGVLGAGKSHLARAIIRAYLAEPELEVPSPSYTLVNVYAHDTAEVWHADLYRLSGGDDIDELGLRDATDAAIVLVEWPDRWSGPPERRLEITLEITGEEARRATVQPRGDGWDELLDALEWTE